MSTKIYITGGYKESVGGTITEKNGKDISGATFQIALNGSKDIPPTVWMTPSSSIAGDTPAERIVTLLLSATPPGLYFCWVRVADSPEDLPIMVQGNITVV